MIKTKYLFDRASFPVIGEYDVAVIGAGPGGIGAAVSAARMGMKTILVEQYGFPGGVATNGCCPLYFLFSSNGKQIIGGVADELIRILDEELHDASFMIEDYFMPEYLPINKRQLLYKVVSTVEGIRIANSRLLKKSGVVSLFYAHLFGAVEEGGRIVAAAVDCLEGPCLIKAKTFVDATGDAHMIYRAGGGTGTVMYSFEESMHKSMSFEVGGVTAFNREVNNKVYKNLYEAGKTPANVLPHLAIGHRLTPGVVQIGFNKALGMSVDSADMTRMDAELREQIPEIVDFLRREIPGFKHCYLINSAIQVGVRAGRGIIGIGKLTKDIIAADELPEKPIALITKSYGSHSVKKEFTPKWRNVMQGISAIPLDALIPVRFTNVLACGRCISADPHVFDTFRMMTTCMVTGQAAGITAALSARDNVAVKEVPYDMIRSRMLETGCILEPDK